MKTRLFIMAIALASLTACESSDESVTTPDSTDQAKNCPTCKTCPECQPNEKECPHCEDSQNCPTCDCETCHNDLDQCNDDLELLKLKPKSLSGSRLKLLAHVGADGSRIIQDDLLYDKVLDRDCQLVNLDTYGCDGLAYCIPDPDAFNAFSAYKDLAAFDCLSIYETDTYTDTYLNIILRKYLSIPYATIQTAQDSYYTDPACQYRLNHAYVEDPNCHYNSETIFMKTEYKTESTTNICIDGSSYTDIQSSNELIRTFYQAINNQLVEIYEKSSNGNSCYKRKDKIVIQVQAIDASSAIEEAKKLRKNHCTQLCIDADNEAKANNWVKFTTQVIDTP